MLANYPYQKKKKKALLPQGDTWLARKDAQMKEGWQCCLEVFISDGRLHCILKDADTSFILHTIVCTQF